MNTANQRRELKDKQDIMSDFRKENERFSEKAS